MLDRRPAAISFDAGNTLLYCDPPPSVVYADRLSRYGRQVSPEEVAPAFAASWIEMQSRTPPGQDRYSSHPEGERGWWGAFVRQVLRRLNHSAPWRPLLDDLYAAFSRAELWHAFPDTLDTLRILRDRGLRLAVISNWDRRLPEILDQLGIGRLVDVTSVSAIEGVEKPSPEIFRRTVERLGVAAAETVHVGDSPREDYGGSRRAGVQPVLIDRTGLFEGAPYRRIGSLHGLLEMVDGHRHNWVRPDDTTE